MNNEKDVRYVHVCQPLVTLLIHQDSFDEKKRESRRSRSDYTLRRHVSALALGTCSPRRRLAGQLPDDVIELSVCQIRLRSVLRGDVLRQALLVLHLACCCLENEKMRRQGAKWLRDELMRLAGRTLRSRAALAAFLLSISAPHLGHSHTTESEKIRSK